MNSTKAIFKRLSEVSEVISEIDAYLGQPAIFDETAPDKFLVKQDKPCIVIAVPSSDVDASTLTETVRLITQDVRLYAKRSGDNQPIDDLARLVRDLFHLRPDEITVDGGTCTIATATGPVASPTTDQALVGRRVTLRLELKKD